MLLRRLAVPAIILALVIGAGWLYLFSYSAPPVKPEWQLAALETPPATGVTVRFSGTSTLLFSDGETQWMIDGWFSRPGPLQLLLGSIAPDRRAIQRGLALNEVTQLAAVIPMHSHYDHAMDAPIVAQLTGARLIGSNATANIGRGLGLPEQKIQVVADGDQVRLGQFLVTFVESRHIPYSDPDLVKTLLEDSEIGQPLVPPASPYDYKLGKAWVLHIEHPRGDMVVIGSAGFEPGLLAAMDADVVFLGIGALGSQSEDYRRQFWRHTVGALNPGTVILIHWDSLTGPLEGPLVGEIRGASLLAGSPEVLADFLQARLRENPDRPLHTLPRFKPVLVLP